MTMTSAPVTDEIPAAVRQAVLDRSDERDTYLRRIVASWREGYERGYTQGWKDGSEDGFPPPRYRVEWSETYEEMEERRYGPLPEEGFTEPAEEEHPGQARRRARALTPCDGDFEGGRP